MRVQRESFDVIGVVGFGKDMGASRNIFDPSATDTFRLMGDQLTEFMRRVLNPLRQYMTFLPVRGHTCCERLPAPNLSPPPTLAKEGTAHLGDAMALSRNQSPLGSLCCHCFRMPEARMTAAGTAVQLMTAGCWPCRV